MKWTNADADLYQKAKEYVDTAVIPLVPAAGGKKLEESIMMGEFVEHLTDYLERQYKGRVFLLPSFTYLRGETGAADRLREWTYHFEEEGFQHFLFVTADMAWRQERMEDAGELVWLPAFDVSGLDGAQRRQAVEQQAQQIIPLMTGKWS
ncbi:YpiF family protein [Alkalicoccus chagannorensis]|uniref:YpiF family protein n=1 Tax=Alkalicoccus chagannorensis TaxID=427072 RepID=UPI00040FDD4B|nr:YpiF family protein [Alkalicoccus chagannorensis]